MATTEEGEGGGVQPPGLGRQRRPRFRRSEVTRVMAGGGGGGVGGKEEGSSRERVREPPFVYVLALPAAAPPAVVSRLEAAVPRKGRSCLPRAAPSAWWSYRIPLLPPLPPPPPPAKDPVAEEEGRRFPRPQRVRVAPSPDPATASAAEKSAKRARRCVHCDAAETPQWRSGPMGRGTLCNACGVWYSRGALPEHRPAASPVADSAPESPIWEPEVPGAIYLVRKTPKQTRPSRTEAAPAPRPATSCLHCGSSEPPRWREGPMGRREVCTACGARYKKGRLLPECRPATSPIAHSPPESPIWEPQGPAPAVYLARKPAKQGRPAKRGRLPSKKSRSCLHCGSSETPQWREGPQGRGTLCNACGVRYKQGRLLPEYRPMASPTFVPSEHANTHRRVLQLHRQRRSKDQHPPPPRLPVGSAIDLPPFRDDHPADKPGHAGEHQADATGCADDLVDVPSSLDSLLLDGPSAPLIVESDEFLIN